MRRSAKVNLYIFLALLIALPVVGALSLLFGRYMIAPGEAIAVLEAKLSGVEPVDGTAAMILGVRFSRIAAAAIIGGALAAAGAAYQGIFRNPMVSPDILGASAGAGFGAALGIMMGLSPIADQVLAFLCGILAVLITMGVSSRFVQEGGGAVLLLVLTGMVVSALFSAFVSIVKYVADPYDTLPAITFWLMGGLSYVTGSDVRIMLAPFVLGVGVLLLVRWKLNILSLSEDEAKSLGVDPPKMRALVIVCATLVTSSAVAVGGMIGWVGLIIPHLARMLVGPDYRALLPVSLVLGSLYLLLADDVARCALSQEIPLGVLTAVAGAPFFLYLIAKGKGGWI